MKNCEGVLRNIDWELLREQKNYCLNEAAGNIQAHEMYGATSNKLAYEIHQGIVSLIDHLQAAAVLDGVATEKEVFGANGDG